ncbi:hypothetical protein BOX15_Mlig015623g2 [Macrostomum lignano]|uniref:PDZ domain-containing protein n=1 Tax=Macrostomum lignano TaxID=282301 RepID=A0A267G8X2_9PLAT|nr:hypothetical protein BOX15_Mlig015623g2 [Macrostomum lignano]
MSQLEDLLTMVSLRRYTSDKAWGFALQGGTDFDLPVFVHKITRNSVAHKCGLEPGDVIVKINQTYCSGFAHSQVKAEVLRAGNELDFTVKKRAFNVAAYGATAAGRQASPPPAAAAVHPVTSINGGQVSSKSNRGQGGPVYKNVKPKTYQILESQLPQSESGGALPASYRDRAMADHSAYIKANGPTIQRAFGEA